VERGERFDDGERMLPASGCTRTDRARGIASIKSICRVYCSRAACSAAERGCGALAHGLVHSTVQAPSIGVDRGLLGSQAFQSASAFNANIGAWNIARVTTLPNVCAAYSARAARHRGGMRSACLRCGAAAVRLGTADARACSRTHV
jgi:hypothetical protein